MTTATSSIPSPPESSSRAHDILSDLRQKRESLVTLRQKGSVGAFEGEKKPPRAPPGKSKKKKKSKRAVKDIRAEMKKKRDALSIVLDSHKNRTGLKRLDDSIGPSTAPTGASTRSWMSSQASDDFSLLCSDNEEGEISNSIEFIIETEDSDMNSVSTSEEVTRAIGTIYEQVIPHALSALQLSQRTSCRDGAVNPIIDPTTYDKSTDWETELSEIDLGSTYKTTTTIYKVKSPGSNSSPGRDVLRNDRIPDKISKKEKAKRRKKKVATRTRSRCPDQTKQSAVASSPSGSAVGVKKSRKHRKALKGALSSVSELHSIGHDKIPPLVRARSRQDDSSVGAAPAESPRRSSRSEALWFGDTSDKQPPKTKETLETPSQVASLYILEKRMKHGSKKQLAMKTFANVVTANDTDSGDESLLVTPVSSEHGDESLLASPTERHNVAASALKLDLQSEGDSQPLDIFENSHDGSDSRISPYPQPRRRHHVHCSDPSTPDLAPENSISRDEVRHVDRLRLETPRLDHKGADNKDIRQHSSKKKKVIIGEPEKSGIDYTKSKFTKMDLITEFNVLARQAGKKGLTIPTGTVITLKRREKIGGVYEEERSSSGWTFNEPSDLSTSSYTLEDHVPVTDRATADSSCFTKPSIKRPTVLTRSEDESTQRFCGGMYHLAVLSGMEPCEQEI